MRLFFEENDLVSGEIQQIHSDGGVNIQTRNLKYGKVKKFYFNKKIQLKNGIIIKVDHNLIKRMKLHFFDVLSDIKAIIGMNGYIWIYYSTLKLDSEYFTDDQTQLNQFNKHEVIKKNKFFLGNR